MPIIKFDRTGACSGGGHTHFDMLVDGVAKRSFTASTADILDPPRLTEDEVFTVVMLLLKLNRRATLKQNPAMTNAQYVAYVEASEWVI